MTVRAHFYEIDGRVQGGVFGAAAWCGLGWCRCCFGVWRVCKIDGSVLGGMQLQVLLGVLLEALVCNSPPVFGYLGSTLV